MSVPDFPSLPNSIGWPLTRAPIWSNMRQTSVSGKTTRIQLYTFPRYRWTATFPVLLAAAGLEQFQTLMGFINSVASGALPFYYTDAYDNAVTAQSFGTGDGTTTAFQLVRTFGGYVEPVQSVTGTPTIAINGTPTASFTLGDTGIVTFGSAPANGTALTWTGSYKWLCTLDADSSEFSETMSTYFELTDKLSFTSEKL